MEFTKKCLKCGEVKDYSEFKISYKTLDGKSECCRDCIKERSKEQLKIRKRNFRIKNPKYDKEYHRKYGKEYRLKKPEYNKINLRQNRLKKKLLQDFEQLLSQE
jgi:bisphosphoglycerate-dependent phosphoglycerate mutase